MYLIQSFADTLSIFWFPFAAFSQHFQRIVHSAPLCLFTKLYHRLLFDFAQERTVNMGECQEWNPFKEHTYSVSPYSCGAGSFGKSVFECAFWYAPTCKLFKNKKALAMFAYFLQGSCSLTALKVSGCRTPSPISPPSLREATFTPPLAKSTARPLSAWPTSMISSCL